MKPGDILPLDAPELKAEDKQASKTSGAVQKAESPQPVPLPAEPAKPRDQASKADTPPPMLVQPQAKVFDDWRDEGGQNHGPQQREKQAAGQARALAFKQAARQRLETQRHFGWAGILGASIAGLFLLLLLADAVSTITWLYSFSMLFGTMGLVLLVFLIASLSMLIYREWRALASMSKQQDIRQLAETSEDEAPQAADKAMQAIETLYAKRSETAWHVAQFQEQAPASAYSAQERMSIFERDILRPLDEQALDLIEQNARNTAIITTISPFAIFDAAFTLWRNLRMIRQVATIYGIAPGFLGSVSLLRKVFANVLLTGGLEAADGVLNQVLGGSMAAKVSAKLGEGLVNGMLSARLGISAMDQCRPLPFTPGQRPRLTHVARRLVSAVKSAVMQNGSAAPAALEDSDEQR